MSNEVRITDPATGGQKGQKDERYDLIPWDAMDEIARVYGVGARKYADDNWLRGYRWRLSFGALFRHVALAMTGEDVDPETGRLHLAHAAWHCLTLITFLKRGLGTDDRAKLSKEETRKKAERIYIGDKVRIVNGSLRSRGYEGVVTALDRTHAMVTLPHSVECVRLKGLLKVSQ